MDPYQPRRTIASPLPLNNPDSPDDIITKSSSDQSAPCSTQPWRVDHDATVSEFPADQAVYPRDGFQRRGRQRRCWCAADARLGAGHAGLWQCFCLGAFGGQGALSEYLVVDAGLVALKPRGVSMAEAAGLPIAGCTALSLLEAATRVGGLRRVGKCLSMVLRVGLAVLSRRWFAIPLVPVDILWRALRRTWPG